MLGGVSFEIRANVQLTDEEQTLVKHYNLNNMVLLSRPGLNIWGQPNGSQIDIKVSSFLTGQVFSCKDLDEVLAFDEGIKSTAQNLKGYLEVARTFGGDEILEL